MNPSTAAPRTVSAVASRYLESGMSRRPSGAAASRTAVDNATVRSVFVIGPDKKVKLSITYPASTGRNFDEILRVIDSLQLTDAHKVATPANWQQGEDVVIVPSLQDPAELAQRFPQGYRVVKPYLRMTAQPGR